VTERSRGGGGGVAGPKTPSRSNTHTHMRGAIKSRRGVAAVEHTSGVGQQVRQKSDVSQVCLVGRGKDHPEPPPGPRWLLGSLWGTLI